MRAWLLLALLCLAPAVAQAERNELAAYNGALTLSFRNLPVFADYPAEPAPHKRAKDVQFKVNSKAWRYRTTLQNALAGEPDFNGHYVFATAGCGTGCQLNWIIDVETGRIAWHGQTEMGVAYRRDSSLFIPNLYETELDLTGGAYFGNANISFYKVQAGKATIVAQVSGGVKTP